MSAQTPLEQEVAKLIVETLNLEDIEPESIKPESALFNDGLGLDSIDALELSVEITKRYGFKIKSDDNNNVLVFSNLRSISQHIEEQRKI